jgi:hypothetical protein
MGLSITVQKGHDFSSGNVTRAALNAGATPTIAITGSVGASEIAASSINNAQIKNDAAIAVTKLGLTAHSLILGDGENEGSVLSPTAAFSNIGNNQDSNCGLLVDTGAKFEVLKTDTGVVGGNVSLTKFKDANDNFWLKLRVADQTLTAAHMSEADTVDKQSIVKNSAGKFGIRDKGVHHEKLYDYQRADGEANAGFLAYGSGGAAHVVEATADQKVLVTAGANENMEGKVFNKRIEIGKLKAPGWRRKEHGLKDASNNDARPSSCVFALECTTSDGKYVPGDLIYDFTITNYSSSGDADANRAVSYYSDIKFVGFVSSLGAGANGRVLDKNGGDTPTNDQDLDGDGYSGIAIDLDDWQVVAFING